MLKKSMTFVLILLFLLLLPLISSVSFDMKTEFNQGETLLVKISGYFLEPILRENVLFYRKHVRIPMEYEIAKIDEEYYVYANLAGKNPNNYSIVIRDVRHMEFTEVTEKDIIKNFSINENKADFSLNPGFVIADEDFFVEVQNLKNEEIVIKIEINTDSKIEITEEEKEGFFSSLFRDRGESGTEENQPQSSLVLKPGEVEEIIFSLDSFKQGLNTIELSTDSLKYRIPVYVSLSQEELEEKEKNFKFEPSELNISLATNSNTTRILYLHNTGGETLENILISVSNLLKPYINLSIENISELKNDSSIAVKIFILPREQEEYLEGYIKAKIEGDTGSILITYSQIFLSFLDDYVPINGDDDAIGKTIKTCLEIQGQICEVDEKCDGEIIDAKDGKCCLGNCEKVKKSPAGRIIGVVILVFIVGALIWFYKKKRKKAKKKPIDLLKIARGKK